MNLKEKYSPDKKKINSLMEREIPQDSWPPVDNSKFINTVISI